jgi:G3E family GTPase
MSKHLPSITTLQHRCPISVITGFLGSGKTTLLNKLLQHPAMQHAAVVINEFGNVGIDHLLVRAATEDIVLMDNGCLCCTIRGDMVATLQELLDKRERGEIPQFDRIVMETTGLADPAPIIHTLLNDDDLKGLFYLDHVITTVDGVYGLQQLDQHYETVKQSAVADTLIITKTDLTESPHLTALIQRLQKLNPAARIFHTVIETAEIAQLFNHKLYNPATKHLDVQRWLQADAYRETAPMLSIQSIKNIAQNTDIHHDDYIRSFCIEYDDPISWTVLNRWFQQLTALRGKDLLRTKGIVYTQETELPVIVQGVQHIFQPPTTLEAWHIDPPRSQIVFITRNLEKAVLEKMLDVLVHSKTHVESIAAALILLRNAA